MKNTKLLEFVIKKILSSRRNNVNKYFDRLTEIINSNYFQYNYYNKEFWLEHITYIKTLYNANAFYNNKLVLEHLRESLIQDLKQPHPINPIPTKYKIKKTDYLF